MLRENPEDTMKGTENVYLLPPSPGLCGSYILPFVARKKKKKYNLKVENYILFGGLAEDLSPEGSLSDVPEGLLQ